MARLNPFLLRLSRWPRRIAALVCLLLAAASTLAPAGPSGPPAKATAPTGNPIAVGLSPGQVAVPVSLASGRAAAFVRTGDHVGVLASSDETTRAGPELVADGLRVLGVSGGSSATDAMSADPPVIVVAANPAEAVRLAAVSARSLLVVVDKAP